RAAAARLSPAIEALRTVVRQHLGPPTSSSLDHAPYLAFGSTQLFELTRLANDLVLAAREAVLLVLLPSAPKYVITNILALDEARIPAAEISKGLVLVPSGMGRWENILAQLGVEAGRLAARPGGTAERSQDGAGEAEGLSKSETAATPPATDEFVFSPSGN